MSLASAPSANLEARLCTFSKILISFLRCGDHTGEQYSSIGLTKLLYNLDNNSGFFGRTVRLIKSRTLLAVFAHLVAFKLHDRFDVIYMPRSLTSDTVFSVLQHS